MGERTQYTPLTEQEQAFATEHCHMIENFLRKRGYPIDDWYDVVVFRYLLSVKKWFSRPDLHHLKFSTIAYNAMKSAVSNELKKRNNRIQPISLDAELPDSDGACLMDTVTVENLNYIYIGENNMKISYNVEIPDRRGAGAKKSDEINALETFLESEMKNMCIQYDTTADASKKATMFRSYKKNHNHKTYEVIKNGKCVYIAKFPEPQKGVK